MCEINNERAEYATLSLTLTSIRHSTDSNFCPFCISREHCCKYCWSPCPSWVLHFICPLVSFHPGDCTSVNQASFTSGPSLPLRPCAPLKNTSNNGIVSTVENSRMLLVDFCWFSGKFRTMSSVTTEFIYQVYIETYKCTIEERLKTFAQLRHDQISLALRLGQTSLWLKQVCE